MMTPAEPAPLSCFGAKQQTVPVEDKTVQKWLFAGVLDNLFAIWSRVLVLFGALAGIKVLLLARLGKHLLETHWRVAESAPHWSNIPLFAAFVSIGVLTLIRLGRESERISADSVRV